MTAASSGAARALPPEPARRSRVVPAPRVRIVGAFDRFNYGDILFAHLSEQVVRARWPDAEIGFYGTHRSDMRPEGGVKTRNLRDLFAAPPGPGAEPDALGVRHGKLPARRAWSI